MKKETVGVKFDQDKPSMSSIPKEAMYEMGLALGYGAKKYGDGNYRNGMLVSRQLAAAVRHIYQHLDGENLDPESGTTHIGHALASLAMAAYTLANHPDMDDRHDRDKAKHSSKPQDKYEELLKVQKKQHEPLTIEQMLSIVGGR